MPPSEVKIIQEALNKLEEAQEGTDKSLSLLKAEVEGHEKRDEARHSEVMRELADQRDRLWRLLYIVLGVAILGGPVVSGMFEKFLPSQ